MLIQLEPIHFDEYNCFDDIVATIAKKYNRDYELMFLNQWDFSMYSSNYNNQQRRDDLTIKSYNLLKNFHGIKGAFKQLSDKDSFLSEITTSLLSNRYIAIKFDGFNCPWDIAYNKYHTEHMCIITGIDISTNTIVITDPYFSQTNKEVQLDAFLENPISYHLFCKTSPSYSNTDYEKIIKETIEEIVNPKEINMFYAMERFANDIKLLCNNEKSTYNIEQINITPLTIFLENMVRSRLKFSRVLNFISSKSNNSSLLDLAEDFKYFGSKWRIIKGMYIKALFSDNIDNLTSRLSDKILEIASLERLELDKFANLDFNCNSHLPNIIKDKENISASSTDKLSFVKVNLSKYFNNNGFGTTVSDDCPSDLTGGYFYLLADDTILQKELSKDNFHFSLTNITNYNNDNISCQGQTIELPKGNYFQLHILACAEWGDFQDKIRTNYSNCDSKDESIGITNCILNPVFNETLIWNGKSVEKRNGVNQIVEEFSVRLFGQTININPDNVIKSIQLPDCPNIHVFAITLVKI